MTSFPRIRVFASVDELNDNVVDLFIDCARTSMAESGRFTVALAGGSTPQPVYARLATDPFKDQVDWSRVHLFWGDERYVPSDDEQSNYRMVREALMDRVPIPSDHVHRVRTEQALQDAARSYENEMRHLFPVELPRFDLILLGMGEDGHTASLFPHSMGLSESTRWFIANTIPGTNQERLTLTFPAINAARCVVVLVRGKSKADMVAAVLHGPQDLMEKPVQAVNPAEGELVWMLDEGAASKLSGEHSG